MTKENHIGTMLITGNGFDLNLGMKTEYKDFFDLMESMGFWDRYKDNRLLSYIYEKGAKDCWYSFEEIIKDFAIKNSEHSNQIINDCKTALTLLKDELCKFIGNARPIYGNYSAASKILCALFGCDGSGAVAWNERIRNRYDDFTDRFYLPKFKFITFNYTDPSLWLMRIIKNFVAKPLVENISSMSERVYNIHGKLEENIVFGTDEDERIPRELLFLRKCHYLERNTKSRFYQDLCNSKRIVIFGHSVHGIDFEYYEKFFKDKNNTSNIYILSYSKKSLNEIEKGLKQKGIMLPIKYIITNVYDTGFCNLCDIINKEQSNT